MVPENENEGGESTTTESKPEGFKHVCIKASGYAPRKGTDDEGNPEGLVEEVASALKREGADEDTISAFRDACDGQNFDGVVEAAKQVVTIKLKK